MSNTVQNGKGSKPRNCFNNEFRNNYDNIVWSNRVEKKALSSPIKQKSKNEKQKK